MTLATGDIVYNANGGTPVNPLALADTAASDAAWELASDAYMPTDTTFSLQALRYTGTVTATTVYCEIEIQAGNYMRQGGAVVDTSGNGYGFIIIGGTDIFLYRIVAWVLDTEIATSATITLVAGDRFRLTVNTTIGTNNVTVTQEGTNRQTASDATYTTGLAPAMLGVREGGTYYGMTSWGLGIGAGVSRSADSIDSFQRGDTNSIISCTGLDAAPTTQTVTVTDGTLSDTCTINTWSATAIDIDIDVALPPGTYDIEVTDDTGTVTLADQVLVIEAGRELVTFDGNTPPVSEDSLPRGTTEDHPGVTPVAGDMWGMESNANVTYNADGSVDMAVAQTHTLAYWFFDVDTATMYTGTVTLAEEATLTNQTLTSTGQNTQQAQVDVDIDTGDIHAYWLESATPPLITDLETGAGAVYKTTQAVTSAGTKTINGTGLTAATTYYCHLAENNSGVWSDIVTTAGVATDAAPADTTPDAIVWTDVPNADINTLYQDIQQVTGVDAGETLTPVGCEISNDNQVTWHSTPLPMVTGQTYARAQVTTGASYSTPYDQIATVNGVGDILTATTRQADTVEFRQPYASTSAFNRPIGASASYSADVDNETTEIRGRTWNINTDNGWSFAVIIAEPTDPLYTVTSSSPENGNNLPYQLRIPDGFPGVPETSDGQVVIYDRANDTVHEFYQFALNGGSPTAAIHRTDDSNIASNPANPQNIAVSVNADIVTGNGHPDYNSTEYVGTRASRTGGLGGLLRNWELTDPGIYPQHALNIQLAYEQLSTNYEWPAGGVDGSVGLNTGHINYGALVAIPPVEKNGPDLDTLGLTDAGMRVAKALVYYGGIVTDRRGTSAGLEGDQYIASSVNDDIRNDINTHLLQYLTVVTNADHTQQYSGGGVNTVEYHAENNIPIDVNYAAAISHQTFYVLEGKHGGEYIDFDRLSITDGRLTDENAPDSDGIDHVVPAGTPLRAGGRIVDPIPDDDGGWSPTDIQTWTIVGSAAPADNRTLDLTASSSDGVNPHVINDAGYAERTVVLSVLLSGTPGDEVRVIIQDRGTWGSTTATITLTATVQQYSVTRSVAAGASGIQTRVLNDSVGVAKTIYIDGVMLEDVTGKANQNPSTFTTTQSISDHENGNTVVNNVVIPAQGVKIPDTYWLHDNTKSTVLTQPSIGFPQSEGTLIYEIAPQWTKPSIISDGIFCLRLGVSSVIYLNSSGHIVSYDGTSYRTLAALTWAAGDTVRLAVRWGGGLFEVGGKNITADTAWVWSNETAYDGDFNSDNDFIRHLYSLGATAHLRVSDIYDTKYMRVDIESGLAATPVLDISTWTGDVIGTVQASDPDGDTLTYSIIAGNTDGDLDINPDTGELTWFHAPDSNRTSTYNPTVQVSDGELTASETVTVNVLAASSGGGDDDCSGKIIQAIIKQVTEPVLC